MGKGRREIEKIGKKRQGVSIGNKREIVTTMDPAWFIVQSLIFSSGGSSGIVVLLTMTTAITTTTVTMAMMAPLQCFQSGRVSCHWSDNSNPKWLSQLSLEWQLLALGYQLKLLCSHLLGLASR